MKPHALVWNYQTTGEPLEIKENPAILREPEGGYNARPFFSIVMAAYNQGKFIDETVKSVVGQSYERWELIIVNDGSKDDSWQRATALMEKFPKRRIRLLNKRNGGLADARNVGLGFVKGTWLCMLDSDDLLGRDYLHRAADLIEEDANVDIVPGCMRNFDAVSSDWCFPEGFSIVGISHWNKFHASVLVNRRLMEKVGGYDPAIPWGLEDWNFWLRSSVHNPIVRFVPEITFFYRHHQVRRRRALSSASSPRAPPAALSSHVVRCPPSLSCSLPAIPWPRDGKTSPFLPSFTFVPFRFSSLDPRSSPVGRGGTRGAPRCARRCSRCTLTKPRCAQP